MSSQEVERRRQVARAWYHRNKEKVAAYKKKHYEEHLEDYKERARKHNKSERRKQWRIENKERISEYMKQRWLQIKDSKPHLKKVYGITLEEYNELVNRQDGRCAGCKKTQEQLDHPLHVDHCHSTGNIRGLLCRKCNSALGYVEDSVETLENLKNYLNSDQSVTTNKN